MALFFKSFKLKNPRKGTETFYNPFGYSDDASIFQIKESPEGDWNDLINEGLAGIEKTFKLKNPRKGTETRKLPIKLRRV